MDILTEVLSCIQTAVSVLFNIILYIAVSILIITIVFASGWLIGRPIDRLILEKNWNSVPVTGPILSMVLTFIFFLAEDSKSSMAKVKGSTETATWQISLTKGYFEAMVILGFFSGVVVVGRWTLRRWRNWGARREEVKEQGVSKA